MSFFHSNILFIIMIINQTYQFYCKQYPIFPSQGLQSTSLPLHVKRGNVDLTLGWCIHNQASCLAVLFCP